MSAAHPRSVNYLLHISTNSRNLKNHLPATRKVIRQVSFGKYNLSLEPLATNCEKEQKKNVSIEHSGDTNLNFLYKLHLVQSLTSTIPDDLPARCKKGKNCFAFVGS